MTWHDIPGYPNYKINLAGQVLRVKCGHWNYPDNKVLTPSEQGQVLVKKNGKHKSVAVAALLLRTFKGPPPDKKHNLARHLDDNKKNNDLSNLAWGSRYDNMQDAIRNGRHGKGSPSRMKAAAKLRGKKRPRVVVAKMVATRRANGTY